MARNCFHSLTGAFVIHNSMQMVVMHMENSLKSSHIVNKICKFEHLNLCASETNGKEAEKKMKGERDGERDKI